MTAQEKLLLIVERTRGDDLERAELAFRGLTKEQLAQEYAASGRSKGEMLDIYRKERREWEQVYALVKQLASTPEDTP